jgi:hypothetical protein
LGQSLESPFEAPSSPHEEVPATSSKPEVHLDDVIERIEKPRLDENSTPSQSAKQPGSYQKGPLMNQNNPCKRNMMLSSRMGHESWWTLHLEPNQLDASVYSRTSID